MKRVLSARGRSISSDPWEPKALKTRAALFDLGGTLLVMRRDRIFLRVLGEEGYEPDPSSVHSVYARADSWWLSVYGGKVMTPGETAEAYRSLDEKVFSDLFPRASPPERLRVSRLVRKRWPELEGEIPLELYPDAEPTLNRLKADGYFLALVSNAPAETTETIKALGLSKYLQSVVVSGVVGFSKPNPEIFKIVLKELAVTPEEAVHVGDLYEADIVGARNAGIRGLLINRDTARADVDCPQIKSLSEVYSYLS